ncbi:MAG: biotin--[acetyl-CoA-carboxylase] ligase [Desulfitobacterium hafniense]|nr:biotin--[acetyl-CoA-carboxylase] ligase [Desulfitobacterium hafniense]
MRGKILDLLVNSQGHYLSGESISKSLNITRAAVWKQIQILKDLGYGIEAQTKNGYRLQKITSELDEWAIAYYLETERLGQRVILFEELASTNDFAKENVKQGEGDGFVVIAKKQTAGRGRLGRKWESSLGGLWLTAALKPNLNLADASKVTLAAGVAMVTTLQNLFGLKTQIKWPNDVMYEDKKLAGILGEVVGEWNTVQTLILGIGLNANVPAPKMENETLAASLLDILGYPVNLNLLAARFIKQLEEEVKGLEQGGFETLRKRWIENAAGLGREVIVYRGTETFRGIFSGITADGELLLDINGQQMSFVSGEVKLRGITGYF